MAKRIMYMYFMAHNNTIKLMSGNLQTKQKIHNFSNKKYTQNIEILTGGFQKNKLFDGDINPSRQCQTHEKKRYNAEILIDVPLTKP